jgi:hypothetical protein
MELPVVSALEFEQLKSSIKTFIKTKTDFKDYDFEGSNLSMLVDILAYNTLYTSYNVNMAANELNLDTAVLRDNIVSIAKRLGYAPSSYTSSKVIIDVVVNNIQNYDIIKVLPGNILAASANGKNFKFILRDILEVDVRGKTSVVFPDVEVLEGSDFSITYTVDETNEHQRFFIPTNNVDSETIRAFVISDPTTNIEEEYEKKSSIVNIDGASKIFFVEEVQDQKYEVIFGDDVFGRKLRNGEVIRLQYVISSGAESNNIKLFDFVGSVSGVINNTENLIGLSNIEFRLKSDFSDGGSEFENIKSIKYAAPRYFASQERAVTVSDYESIVSNIYSNADLIKVFGGEDLTPPRFGVVFIAIKPKVGEKVSASQKDRIIRELKNYQVGSITPNIVDADILDIKIKPIVYYDKSKTRKTLSDILSDVNAEILTYIDKPSFNSFGGLYSNSELVSRIKDLDTSIKFVNILTYLEKSVDLTPGPVSKYDVDFFTKLKTTTKSQYYMMSDPFCATGYTAPVYLAAVGNCDYSGDINLYSIDGRLLELGVGEIDEKTGSITFSISPCQDTPLNITVIPDVVEIITGPSTNPNIVVLDILVNSDDIEESLNPDNNLLPIDEILKKPAEGDPNTGFPGGPPLGPGDGPPLGPGGPTITVQSPDGNTYIIPAPNPDIGGSLPFILPNGFDDQIIPVDPNDPTGGTDPNNVTTIDDFTPEINPNICS